MTKIRLHKMIRAVPVNPPYTFCLHVKFKRFARQSLNTILEQLDGEPASYDFYFFTFADV